MQLQKQKQYKRRRRKFPTLQDADSHSLPYLANSAEEPRLLRSVSEPPRTGFSSLSRLKSAMGARVLSVKDLLVLEEGSDEGESEEGGEENEEPGTATSAGSVSILT